MNNECEVWSSGESEPDKPDVQDMTGDLLLLISIMMKYQRIL